MSYDICPASDLITQDFGCTAFQSEWIAAWCPSGRYHSGIDLGMQSGSLWHQPVYATRAGTIVAIGIIGAGDTGFYTYLGNQAVCLKTHDAYVIYAHLDVASVTAGQVVQAGAQIGLVGTRGNSTGPHLHVEVRTDGPRQNVWGNAAAVLDPRPYLNKLTGGTAGSEIQVGGDALTDDIKNLLHDLAQLAALGDVDQNEASRASFRAAIDAGKANQAFINWLFSPQGRARQSQLAAGGTAGPKGDKGDKGDPGASPTIFNITGTAKAV